MAQKTSIIFKNDLKIRNFVTFLFLFLKIFGYYEYHGTLYFSPTRIHAAIKNSFTYG
jgi:hypothetical protein